MDNLRENTSFKQYQRCVICRRNHNQGKKHIYTKCHQETLKKILRKFETKVNEALKTLERPIIEDINWGNSDKFWCYFCQAEFEVHFKMLTATVRYGNLLEHLNSSSHSSSTDGFWGANKLQADLKKIFIVSDEEYKSFQVIAMKAVQTYETAKYKGLREDAAKISDRERYQRFISQTAPQSQNGESQNSMQAEERLTSRLHQQPSCSNGEASSRLTLTAALDNTLSTEIRPNIDDYYEQAERNRMKKSLTKTRPKDNEASFMPMLERIWNKNDGGIKKKSFKNQIKRDIKNVKIPELKRTSVKQLAADTGSNVTHLPIRHSGTHTQQRFHNHYPSS